MSAPKRAMVLAAGFGKRMGGLTDVTPKPLLEVHGRCLIDWAIDRLEDAGVERIVVNLHHLGGQIKTQLGNRKTPAITYSEEPEILDTGGGVRNALAHFGDEPFYVVNGDALWLNSGEDALMRLADAWTDDIDGLLLLHSTVDAYGYRGNGDFNLDPLGRMSRKPECEVVPFLFSGIQILHPRLFAGSPEGAFSLNLLYDRAIESGRLVGLVHDGEWFHINTPDGLEEARVYMQTRYAGVKHR